MNDPIRTVPAFMIDDPTLDPNFAWPPTDLPMEDGTNLETEWHRLQIVLLIDMVRYYWRDRDDYYVNGNMFIHFSSERARNKDFRGPDFFLVKGAKPGLRPYWAIWEEDGRYPDLIIELLSPSTKKDDLTKKKDIYEKTFRTPEYFAYDPDARELQGWRLANHEYQPIKANDKGWMWCSELGLWVGKWQGTYATSDAIWLRFFDKDGNVVATAGELTLVAEEKARSAEEKAHVAEEKAQTAQKQMLAERERAEAAEAELARLRMLLDKNKS